MKPSVRGDANITPSVQNYRGRQAAIVQADAAKTELVAIRTSELIKASNEDLTRSRIELFSFLSILVFVAVTTFAITDRILLIGSRVRFPLLDVTIGIDEFLIVAPLVVLAVHFALLLKFDQLRSKCEQVLLQIEDLSKRGEHERAQNLSLMVATNFIAQWIIGHGRDKFYRWLNRAVYLLVIFFAPLFILLLIAVRALALHWEWLTLLHNTVLSVDVWLILYLRVVLKVRKTGATIAALFSLVGINVVICVPDSFFDKAGTRLWSTPVPFGAAPGDTDRRAFFPVAFFLEGGLDEVTQRPMFYSRNLIVRDDRTLLAQGDKDSVRQLPPAIGQATISLRGRNLRYAILDRSDLHGADLTLTDLFGASLKEVNLKRAIFGCVERRYNSFRALWYSLTFSRSADYWPYNADCSNLGSANLAGADLTEAEFTKFGIWRPSLQRAVLSGATLNFVNLGGANLNGSDLTGAQLVAVDLSGARLIGSSLAHANLTLADLSMAELELTALNDVKLDGANLTAARLAGAELMNASLVAADLSAAVLTGARLRKAHFWKTVPPRAQDVAWVDLSDIDTGEPTSDKKQDIMQSISVIPERSASANLSFQRLKRAVGVEESFIASDGEELDIWRDWSSALSRSPSDPIYQKAVSQIIVDLACHGSEFAAAILRWNKPSTDYYFDTFSPNPLPAPPEDPSLKQVRDAPRYPNTYYGSYEMAPGPVNPLPEWFDLKLLSTTFGGGQCSSADSLPADFVATLEADEQIRRESSVRRRTSN